MRRLLSLLALVVLAGCQQADGSTSVAGQRAAAVAATRSSDTTTTTEGNRSGLSGLRVEPEGSRAGYSAGRFPHWTDADHDGCDTREEVLIAQSRTRAQVAYPGCKVVAGDWLSVYDGVEIQDPAELDVDHVVALAEAWDSGAREWTTARRKAFANDEGPELQAVTARSNRSKGDRDAAEWQPRVADRCRYARAVVAVKRAYDLSVDTREASALRGMLATC
jgi:hypothetical protein